jgi:hypothetical protein
MYRILVLKEDEISTQEENTYYVMRGMFETTCMPPDLTTRRSLSISIIYILADALNLINFEWIAILSVCRMVVTTVQT